MTAPIKPIEYVYDTYEIDFVQGTPLTNFDEIKNDISAAIFNLGRNDTAYGIIGQYTDENENIHYFCIRTLYTIEETPKFDGCYYSEFTISDKGEGNYSIDKCKTYKLTTGNIPSAIIEPTSNNLTGTSSGVFIGEHTLLFGYSEHEGTSDYKKLVLPSKSFFVEGQHQNIVLPGVYSITN